MENIFLTGATGNIGYWVLKGLLRKEAYIYLLIRGQSNYDTKKKYDLLIKEIKNELNCTGNIKSKIIPLKGDLTEKFCGLDKLTYNWIARNIDIIIHCAGDVRMNYSLEKARFITLNSTQNIIELAMRAKNFPKLNFVSTVGVAGKLNGKIRESWQLVNRKYHNTYEQVKSESEMLLYKVKDQLPLTIFRPSMIVGDSTTGKIRNFQIFYYLCYFLTGIKTGGFMPKLGDRTLDIIPIDYVSRAILLAYNSMSTNSKIFHLCSSNKAISLEELKKICKKIYKKKYPNVTLPKEKIVPKTIFILALKLCALQKTSNKKFITPLRFMLAYLDTKQVFDNFQTVKILKIDPPYPHTYLENCLQYYFERRGPELPSS